MAAATATAAPKNADVPIDGPGLNGTRTAPIVVPGSAREQYPSDAPYGLRKIVTVLTAVLDASVTDLNGKTITPFHHGGQTTCVREAVKNLTEHPPQGDDGGGCPLLPWVPPGPSASILFLSPCIHARFRCRLVQ